MIGGDLATRIACHAILIRNLRREIEDAIGVTGEREGRDFGKVGPFAYQLKVRRAELSAAETHLDELYEL